MTEKALAPWYDHRTYAIKTAATKMKCKSFEVFPNDNISNLGSHKDPF